MYFCMPLLLTSFSRPAHLSNISIQIQSATRIGTPAHSSRRHGLRVELHGSNNVAQWWEREYSNNCMQLVLACAPRLCLLMGYAQVIAWNLLTTCKTLAK
jgi:hypothetical protein